MIEISNSRWFMFKLFFSYLPSCLGQETAKWPFSLPSQAATCHPVYHFSGGGSTLSLYAERQAGKLWIPTDR